MRQTIRTIALKVLRSDEVGGERELAASLLRTNPALGNPHVVRCDWCHDVRTLFRGENDGPFQCTPGGWRCGPCNIAAASQEVRF